MFVIQAIQHAVTDSACPDEAEASQVGELVRHGGRADARHAGQLTDATFSLVQGGHDADSGGVPKCAEGLGDPVNGVRVEPRYQRVVTDRPAAQRRGSLAAQGSRDPANRERMSMFAL